MHKIYSIRVSRAGVHTCSGHIRSGLERVIWESQISSARANARAKEMGLVEKSKGFFIDQKFHNELVARYGENGF